MSCLSAVPPVPHWDLGSAWPLPGTIVTSLMSCLESGRAVCNEGRVTKAGWWGRCHRCPLPSWREGRLHGLMEQPGGNLGCVHAHACAPLCIATSAEGGRFRAPTHLKPTWTHPDAHGQRQDRMGAQGPLRQIPILPVAVGEPEDRAWGCLCHRRGWGAP